MKKIFNIILFTVFIFAIAIKSYAQTNNTKVLITTIYFVLIFQLKWS